MAEGMPREERAAIVAERYAALLRVKRANGGCGNRRPEERETAAELSASDVSVDKTTVL